jgi:hypothetical protein
VAESDWEFVVPLTPVRRAAVAVLLLISTACTEKLPAGPSSSNSVPAPVSSAFPAVVKPARIFAFDRGLVYYVQVYTMGSRFVLYDDGSFALQYSDFPAGYEYRGRYKEVEGNITFEWEGWSRGGPWGATGSLAANSLTVRYNFIMQMSDFEDAVYRRTEP